MVRAWMAVVLLSACTGSAGPPPPPIEPAPQQPAAEPAPAPVRVTNPSGLLDYIPELIAGETAIERVSASPKSATGKWQVNSQTITLELSRIDDVRRTRAAFELLGKPASARMNGQELRGLRLQGNPAELSRDLSEPHRAALSAVAANTYLVVLTVQPAAHLDDPLVFADHVDIAGLTRLAIKEHKERQVTPEP